MATITLQLDENGELRLPEPILESLDLGPGDAAHLTVLDGVLTVSKAVGGVHSFADWRSISHELIEAGQLPA